MKTVGVVLAGGKSSRMGQNKSRLQIEGKSLLKRQIELLESIPGIDSVLVSGDVPGYSCILDMVKEAGPLEGLRSVSSFLLKNYGPLNLLIVPVDMPCLQPEMLLMLMNPPLPYEGARFLNSNLPCFLACQPYLLAQLETLRKQKHSYSFKNLFSLLNLQEFQLPHPEFFTNLNTPQDWEAFSHHESSTGSATTPTPCAK